MPWRRFDTSKMHLSPLVAYAAVRSKVVVLLLLIYCLLLLPLFVEILCFVLVLLFSTLCPSSFALILVGCFALTVILMFCDSQCSVALPRGAVGRSVVCDCGIS